MQNHPQNQFTHSSKHFDFCQQCQCFHPAQYKNGVLVMEPCQNSIQQPNYDEKITTQTNVTLPSSQSTNSFSSMSIKNHISQSPKPHVVRPDKYQPNQKTQNYSSKPSQIAISPRIPANSPQKTAQLQSQLKIIPSSKPLQQKTLAANNKTAHTLVQNNQFTETQIIKLSQPIRQLQQLPVIFTNSCQQCFETPQFGSQSRVSQNKQNSISSKRLIKEQKEFFIPKITETRNERTISQLSIQSDYFCCGYIRKCNK